jgi:ribonucleoside-diphosphate reductase alpha chain
MITETAQKILEERYFIGGESNWEDLVVRVSKFLSESQEEYEEYKHLLLDLRALPNSPTLMNAGTGIKSLSACFVLPIEDDIDSIYKYYADAAKISKAGGGVGANFSKLRPEGSSVGSTGGVASGPISFMKVQDVSTDTIKQGGRRRGANMALLSADHPDVRKFIRVKTEAGVLENFNLSVRASDAFMKKAVADRYSPEADILNQIAQRAWESGEPGLVFSDSVEVDNYCKHIGELDQLNPCGEQPLHPYESCCLASINLSVHFDPDKGVDTDKLKQTCYILTRMMNRVVDKNEFPVVECNEAAKRTRKIGIGIMGLHDLLIKNKLPYDSKEGRILAAKVMRLVSTYVKEASESLGVVFPEFDKSSVGTPRANCNLTSIAPTGTLSMLADCSSGCEPYFSPITYKTVLDGETFLMPNKNMPDSMKERVLQDGIGSLTQEEFAIFKGAQDIHWKDHIRMQAILQEFVDSGISKTINMPEDTTVEDIKEAYILAWRSGCKGITVYRDGCRDDQVLKTKDSSDSVFKYEGPYKLDLGDELEAKRYRIRDNSGGKVYFTVCTQDEDPVEVFAKLPEESSDSYWNTICRLLSLSMRYMIPLDDITKQLRKSSNSVSDTPSRLARILDKYKKHKDGYKGNRCPECSSVLTPGGGCLYCEECGWSKCS